MDPENRLVCRGKQSCRGWGVPKRLTAWDSMLRSSPVKPDSEGKDEGPVVMAIPVSQMLEFFGFASHSGLEPWHKFQQVVQLRTHGTDLGRSQLVQCS